METWRRAVARRLITAAGTLALTLTVVVAVGTAAYALSPPWEPDPGASSPYGNVVFYDSSGNRVTVGTDLSNPFAYAVATSANPDGPSYNSDYVAFYAPDHSQPTSAWSGVQMSGVTQFSPSSSLPSDTPPDVLRYSPGNPVASSPQAAITTWLAGIASLDGTAGYANVIQVRLYLSGITGRYWETDIGYNTTSTPISVDGTTVPANGWAVIYPAIVASPPISLTTSAIGGELSNGDPITLTATVNLPAGYGGLVQFYDDGNFLADIGVSGSITAYRYTPGLGDHTYLASYVPDPSAPELTGNISMPMTVSVVNSHPTSGFPGPGNSSNAGNQLRSSTSPDAPPSSSSQTVHSASLAPAVHPAPGSLAVGASPTTGCGSGCFNAQAAQQSVNQGAITITTPYSAGNPFVLPPMTLSSDGTFLESSATFPDNGPNSQPIVVSSSVSPAFGWSLVVSATPLTGPGGGTIPASGLGLTNGQLINASGSNAYPGTVTFSDIPALNPSPVDAAGTGPGLGSTPQAFATSSASDGSAEINGTLTLFASTATPADTYIGTITFSIS